jgi:circadian clock protein KaiB
MSTPGAPEGAATQPPCYRFSLYVSGLTPRSLRAIGRVRSLCDRLAKGSYDLEVVDIYDHPARARTAQIIAVPTLIKEAPLPRRLFVGDMSDTDRLAAGLGLGI